MSPPAPRISLTERPAAPSPAPSDTGRAPPPANATVALSTLPVSPPPGASEAEAALVWLHDDKAQHGVKTFWLSSASAKAGGAVWISAAREEPVVMAGARMLAIRAVEERLSICDCDSCETDAGCKRATVESYPERPALFDMERGTKRSMLDRLQAPGCKPAPIGDISSEFQLLSAVGSLVFLTENVATQHCGAPHPAYEDQVHAVDAASGSLKRVEASPAQIAPMLEPARRTIVEEHDGCVIDSEAAAPPGFYGATLKWGPGGVLRGEYTFTKFAPYACGTGPGHYSVATSLEGELPAERPAVEPAPAWLTAALGSDVVAGISVVPAGASRAKLLARFRTAPLPAKP